MKWGWLLLAFGGVVILLSSELTPAHEGAYHRRVAGAGRGILLCPDRHHRTQTASAPAQHIAFIQVLVGVVMLLPLVHAPN